MLDRFSEQLLNKVAARLRGLEGLVAIVLGGSRARGVASADSDYDLGLYYRPQRPFSINALSEIAAELDDAHRANLVTAFGEWMPWVNGGGWLIIDGKHVDFLYRDLDLVERCIEECRAGQPMTYYQLGHQTGFHNHMYLAEIDCCIPLDDQSGEVARLKKLTSLYPPALRRALMRQHLFNAGFELELAAKSASRDDVFAASGCLFRVVGFLIQVLFAVNEKYFINEKRALDTVSEFATRPREFSEVARSVLGEMGQTPPAMAASVAKLRAQLEEVKEVALRSEPELLAD